MQNDVRLIDANALEQEIINEYFTDNNRSGVLTMKGEEIFNAAIDIARCRVCDAETVDAVPVVRCRECKNRGTPYSCPMRKLVMPWQGAGSYEDCTDDDGYCHMGVKMDEPSP